MVNHEENQYLTLIREIIKKPTRIDRTKVGTHALFGTRMVFNLRNNTFPLLTTKRVNWHLVLKELLWFISGSTDAKILDKNGVKIWNANGSRSVLDKLGFENREEGDLGPIYGFQWRHWGAEYKTCHDNYEGKGIDQLTQIVNTLKTNPTDRRMMLSAWNVSDIPMMALPPCHSFAQFFVEGNELSCMLTQRSGDMGLGVPFNIASYSFLTCMLAHVCNLVPGNFIHVIGDTHVYVNHVEPLKKQLDRTPYAFPRMYIKRKVDNIDDFKFEDFEIEGYENHGAISMSMAV